MRKLFLYHFFPLLISLILILNLLWFFSSLGLKSKTVTTKKILVSGSINFSKGYCPNLSSETDQLKLFSSIKNNHLTLFGSSEFSSSPFCSFNFLPDSINLPTLGIGHGYHQNLSILIECLAFADEIEGKNICVILSPGWFESEGTNTSAFVEFANKNLLNRIILNPSISDKYKLHVGKYIYENQSDFQPLSYQMEFLKNKFQKSLSFRLTNGIEKTKQQIKDVFPFIYSFDTIDYKLENVLKEKKKTLRDIDYKSLGAKVKNEFLSNIHNNSIFIEDDYFEKYIKNKANPSVKNIENKTNEFLDFQILLDFLIQKKTKVSLIMQPLSPYFYKNMENMLPLISKINSLAEQNNIPFLNMYVTDKVDYEPATLKDIMHTGDYGWIKINAFLDSLYNE